MSTRIEFDGLDELLNKISYLGGAEARKVFRAGASAGARLVRNYAIADAPGPYIGIKTRASETQAEAEIGPLKRYWYYKFAESGTRAHGPKKARRKFMMWRDNGKRILAKRVRGIQAKPFLKPALENHIPEVQAAMVAGYKKMLEKVSK